MFVPKDPSLRDYYLKFDKQVRSRSQPPARTEEVKRHIPKQPSFSGESAGDFFTHKAEKLDVVEFEAESVISIDKTIEKPRSVTPTPMMKLKEDDISDDLNSSKVYRSTNNDFSILTSKAIIPLNFPGAVDIEKEISVSFTERIQNGSHRTPIELSKTTSPKLVELSNIESPIKDYGFNFIDVHSSLKADSRYDDTLKTEKNIFKSEKSQESLNKGSHTERLRYSPKNYYPIESTVLLEEDKIKMPNSNDFVENSEKIIPKIEKTKNFESFNKSRASLAEIAQEVTNDLIRTSESQQIPRLSVLRSPPNLTETSSIAKNDAEIKFGNYENFQKPRKSDDTLNNKNIANIMKSASKLSKSPPKRSSPLRRPVFSHKTQEKSQNHPSINKTKSEISRPEKIPIEKLRIPYENSTKKSEIIDEYNKNIEALNSERNFISRLSKVKSLTKVGASSDANLSKTLDKMTLKSVIKENMTRFNATPIKVRNSDENARLKVNDSYDKSKSPLRKSVESPRKDNSPRLDVYPKGMVKIVNDKSRLVKAYLEDVQVKRYNPERSRSPFRKSAESNPRAKLNQMIADNRR